MLYTIIWVVVVLFLLYLITEFIFPAPKKIDPKDKAILVTGAASGIGKCIVEELVKRGAYAFATDYNCELLREVWEDVDNVETLQLDVTKHSDCEAAKYCIKSAGKGLYGIVNNAGISTGQLKLNGEDLKLQALVEHAIESHVKPIMEVNLLGVMRTTTAFFPMILEQKGCIVNIASICGLNALPFLGAYNASKFGVVGYSDTIRRECATKGVRVACIEPGFVATPLTDVNWDNITVDPSASAFADVLIRHVKSLKDDVFDQKMIQPEQVAKVVCDALFSERPPAHQIVDFPTKRIMWKVMSLLPYSWSDYLLAPKTK